MPPRVTRASARLAGAATSSTASTSEPARTTRTSRAATAAGPSTHVTFEEPAPTAPVDVEVDADFLALSNRQQRAVDRAFDRAARQQARKKRRGNDGKPIPVQIPAQADNSADAGGFIAEEDEGGFLPADDAGGFIADDAGGGGFLPPSDDEGGGFMAEDDDDGGFVVSPAKAAPVSQRFGRDKQSNGTEDMPSSIPLNAIPTILSTLNLPYDDDVLAVFRESASGWGGNTEGTSKDVSGLRVARTDFRAVCAALMEPDAGGEEAVMSDGIEEEDDDDVYEEDGGSGTSTPLSSVGGMSDGDMDVDSGPKKSRRSKGKGKGELEAPMGVAPKMTREQKDGVRQTWDMFLEISTQPQRGPRAIGKDEVRKWAKELGETYTEDEIADMINLFSTQPEKRALSYDDFSNVLMRGGLV